MEVGDSIGLSVGALFAVLDAKHPHEGLEFVVLVKGWEHQCESGIVQEDFGLLSASGGDKRLLILELKLFLIVGEFVRHLLAEIAMLLVQEAARLHPEDHLGKCLCLSTINDHLASQVKVWSNLLSLVTEHVTEFPLVTLLLPIVVVVPVPVPIFLSVIFVILIPPALSSILSSLLVRVGLAEDILPHISLLIFILVIGPVIPVVAPTVMAVVVAASASVLRNKLVHSESSKCVSSVLNEA